jgi:signal transduction histidine kinase
MRERADRIGAALRIRTAPDEGNLVELRVPLSAKTRRHERAR